VSRARVRAEAATLGAVAGGLCVLAGGPVGWALGTAGALLVGAEVACRT
jgi:hypothetical protein